MDLYERLNERLSPGMRLYTPRNSAFTLESIQSTGLTVRVGLTDQRIKLRTGAFREVLDYLSEREWVPLGAAHETPKAGTIDEIVQRHTKGTSAASYLVPILVKAGMIELDPGRPAKARIRRD